jgi:putative hemolysin
MMAHAIHHRALARSCFSAVYEVSLATTLEEVCACQRLRYQVFNGELGEGLESSHALGLDRDHFDVICDHLMVRETKTGEVVGTYRMQTGYRAKGNAGYYSESFLISRLTKRCEARCWNWGAPASNANIAIRWY